MPFDGRLLSGVSVLAAIVEGGSFVKAAELIGITDSGVSRAIGRLETRLNVRLLDTVEVRPALLVEAPPLVGQGHGARRALQETDADPRFEPGNRAPDAG